MAGKIYTGTGDKGKTGLFGGARLSKDHIRIEAYGTVDELNAVIGVLYESLEDETSRHQLNTVQNKLFNIGSTLAVDPSKDMNVPGVVQDDVKSLELAIDEMEEKLTPLKNFILPSGNIAAANAHVARTVCRRAERRVITLASNEAVGDDVLVYLNRLSDYLFVLARYTVARSGDDERIWDPGS